RATPSRAVRQAGLAHPYPGNTVLLFDHIGFDTCRGRNGVTMGVGNATPATVELQAVITALDGVALDAAQVQGHEAVRAKVVQRSQLHIAAAKENDGPIQQLSMQHLAWLDFVSPSGHIPGVFKKWHDCLQMGTNFYSSYCSRIYIVD